jgi:predicted secreted protein
MTQHTIPGALRPLLGLLVIGLVVIGCTSAETKTTELGANCDQFDSQKSVAQQADVAVGDLLKVTLCSNPSTGFSWQPPAISDAAVISLVDKGSAGATGGGTEPVVGAAGTEWFTLEATAAGSSIVILRYSQPWLGGISGAWTYTVTVTVR